MGGLHLKLLVALLMLAAPAVAQDHVEVRGIEHDAPFTIDLIPADGEVPAFLVVRNELVPSQPGGVTHHWLNVGAGAVHVQITHRGGMDLTR